MPKSDLADETKAETQVGPVDLLIGISGAVNANDLREHVKDFANGFQERAGISSAVFAYPGDTEVDVDAAVHDARPDTPRLMAYPLAASDPTTLPWIISSNAQKAICSLAVSLDAKACVILRSDLAMLGVEQLQLLAQPILEKQCDLVLPVYPSRKFE